MLVTSCLCRSAAIGFALVWAVRMASAQPVAHPDEVHLYRAGGPDRATFVTPKQGPLAAAPRRGASLGLPRDVLRYYGHLFGIQEPAKQLRDQGTRSDQDGKHTTFQQVHHGVPVFAGVLKVHHDSQQRFVAANGHFFAVPEALHTTPSLDAAHAEALAIAAVATPAPEVTTSELVIVDPGWYGNASIGPQLAYHIIVTDADAVVRETLFIDAHHGTILDRWSMLESALRRNVSDVPSGRNRFDGRLGPTPALLGVPPDINQAFNYLGDAYDLFARGFGRDSFDNRGSQLISFARANVSCPNAFFTDRPSPRTLFCPGFTSDDFVGHEFTHGVTRFSANLIYQNQSGQLNESFSDVFGELTDLYNGNAAFAGPAAGVPWPRRALEAGANYVGPGNDFNNGPGNNKRNDNCSTRANGFAEGVRWLIGEDALSAPVIRDMWRPPCSTPVPLPDKVTSPFYHCDPRDNGGVHTGSSVINHAFAILTDGKTFNQQVVRGIGPIKAAAVWYKALTQFLTPASNFQDAFQALQLAANMLINTTPNDPRTGLVSADVFTADDAAQVRQALLAVEMDQPAICGGGIRNFIFLVDTTGSAAAVNPFYNFVIAALTQKLNRLPGANRFALARFDDYPCAPFGNAVTDVPYRLITPFVPAAQIPAFLPVTGPGQGNDVPESQIDAIVTAVTGRALVPKIAGCGPGVPAGQGAFGAAPPIGPTALFLFSTPRILHLPGAGKPHVNGPADVAGLANIIAAMTDDNVLTTLINISFDEGSEPVPGSGETSFKSLLAAFKAAGGQGTALRGDVTTEACLVQRACAFLAGGADCLDPGDTDANGDGVADQCGQVFLPCDLNGDGDVDASDIGFIFDARNVPAAPGEPGDVDGDGVITVNDARACAIRCTNPQCAP